jgi:predicted amidophosphoribosyltransferase
MKQRIHRDKLIFRWFTKNHEIVAGFKRVRHGTCSKCGKSIPWGTTLCDKCFEKDKSISKK